MKLDRSLIAITLVVAIIYFFVLHPLQRPRRGSRPPCISNLHNLSIGIQNFASTNGGKMPSPTFGPHDLSWRYAILPLVDHSAIFHDYHRDKPWNDPANFKFAQTRIPIFVCPTNPTPRDAQGRFYTAYALLTGPGTAYDQSEPRKLEELPNGLTQTILVVEACGANIVWNEPRDLDVDRDRIQVNVPKESIQTGGGWVSSQHGNEINVAFADGSAKTISANIDPDVLKALATPRPTDDKLTR